MTILPAGMALGATEQLPEAERHLYSEGYLNDLLTVRLGGRAAELVVFGEGSTGAANDLTGATQIATRMVRDFGLSTALGPVGYATGAADIYQATEQPWARPYSEQTQRVVDQEVARLLREAEQRAVALLRTHRWRSTGSPRCLSNAKPSTARPSTRFCGRSAHSRVRWPTACRRRPDRRTAGTYCRVSLAVAAIASSYGPFQ